MSIERVGRGAAVVQPCPADGANRERDAQETPAEVLEFIRYCYRRRGIGWPELYDEMCAAAARGSYRGMDYDQLAGLGIGFSVSELPRLVTLSHRVVAEERAARQAAARQVDGSSARLRLAVVPTRG